MPVLNVFPDCCAVQVLNSFPTTRSSLALVETKQNAERYADIVVKEKSIFEGYGTENPHTNITLLALNQDQIKELEPIFLSRGFVPFLRNVLNKKSINRVTLYYHVKWADDQTELAELDR